MSLRLSSLCVVAACVLTPAVSRAELIYGVTTSGASLVTFDSDARTVLSTRTLAGFSVLGQQLISIDVRPSTGELYGLSSTGRLVIINPATGTSTLVGTAPLTTPAVGNTASIDFNPAVDMIRLVNPADRNLRINPTTGAVTEDTALNNASGTGSPNIIDISYAPNVAGSPTTLYGLDSNTNRLVTIAPPNAGTVNATATVDLPFGSVGSFTGFDTSNVTGVSYINFRPEGGERLYRIEPSTGAVTELGLISGTSALRDIAVAVPEPTTLALIGLAGIMVRRRRA